MLTRIGFFHFVGRKSNEDAEDWEGPLGSLSRALSEYSACLRDSLIVLPEAFNIGRDIDWQATGRGACAAPWPLRCVKPRISSAIGSLLAARFSSLRIAST
jgi:hypothetical protein